MPSIMLSPARMLSRTPKAECSAKVPPKGSETFGRHFMSWLPFEVQAGKPRATGIIQGEAKTANSRPLSVLASGLNRAGKMPALQKAIAGPSSTFSGHFVASSPGSIA